MGRDVKPRESLARRPANYALAALAAGVALMGGALAAQGPFPLPGAPHVMLRWYPASAEGPRPVVVALHGCGGLTTRGTLDARYVEYAARWNAAGWHVLLPDSFSARGKASICREPRGQRSVTVAMRRDDVNAALAWVARQPEVDPQRVALVGWSNGGSTVLRTIDDPGWTVAPVAAVAFYPGCRDSIRRKDYAPAVPLLMLVGALDDWTPAASCEALAHQVHTTPGAPLELIVYPDSYHGFDGTAAVRRRTDIHNGVDRGGVHVGGNPEARADSLRQTDHFLHQYLD